MTKSCLEFSKCESSWLDRCQEHVIGAEFVETVPKFIPQRVTSCVIPLKWISDENGLVSACTVKLNLTLYHTASSASRPRRTRNDHRRPSSAPLHTGSFRIGVGILRCLPDPGLLAHVCFRSVQRHMYFLPIALISESFHIQPHAESTCIWSIELFIE
jgi:hypothetical protein